MTVLLGLPVGYEWVVLLVVALFLFGGTRLAGMGKGAGRAIREFKEEIKAPSPADVSPTATPEEHTQTAETAPGTVQAG